MNYLNRELQNRLAQLPSQEREFLTQFLIDIGEANMESEKQDAVTRLRSKIREYVSQEDKK